MNRRQPSAADSSVAALVESFEIARSRTASLTAHMCWHGGVGHGYPSEVMGAAARLRERYGPESGSDDEYTMLSFAPSEYDWRDFLTVLPYCDLAYAQDGNENVIAEAVGTGA